MEKMRIDVGSIAYQYEKNEFDWFPLPKGMVEEIKEVEITGQLMSTVGGGADWRAGEAWKPHLSNAPYCPRINARVVNARIATAMPDHDYWVDMPDADQNELIVFRKAGYSGRNFFLSIQGKEISSDRPLRKNLFERILKEDWGVPFSQGHLSIRPLTAAGNKKVEGLIEELEIPLKEHSGELELFNHQIISYYYTPFIGYDNERLIKVGEEGGRQDRIYVVSPDHIGQPFKFSYQGWWLLSHPIPESKGVD